MSGWGRYPIVEACLHGPPTADRLVETVTGLPDLIARGNGRSYGDASLNPSATVDTRRLDRFETFDADTGLLVCEAGLLLRELIDVMLPRGWFVPVTPGTKLVTVGGMIASDVHGKNHHGAGSFCDHVEWIDLAVGDGRVRRCSPVDNSDLFRATCGGMGLTGVIVRAAFRMIRVESAMMRQRTLRAKSLDQAFAIFEDSLSWTYSVAWFDSLASKGALGRSVILLGEHASVEDLRGSGRHGSPFARGPAALRRVPLDFPNIALSRPAISLFNRVYYGAQRPGDALAGIDPYFYPLDAVLDWNRIYGRRGFVQYQCVLPLGESERGIAKLLTLISAVGQASFLAVLKRLGPASFGLLSFPMEGYTLALDFPATSPNLELLDRLDRITLDHGGRIYLAKDARANASTITAGYPALDEFRAVRRRYGLDQRFSSLLSRRLEI